MDTTTKKTKITFGTREFELSHGRRPRGEGGWAFLLVTSGDRLNETFQRFGLYGECQKVALEAARTVGAYHVEVLP